MIVDEGLALKYDRVKQASRSYADDRVEQAEAAAVSYAIALGLYAAAGIFLIATLLVGATAAFRWIEVQYGFFHAFAALGGLLAVAVLCVILAIYRLKRPAKHIVPLASRLRVAISAPLSGNKVSSAAAVASLRSSPGSKRNEGVAKSALILVATLVGWAFIRRRDQAQSVR